MRCPMAVLPEEPELGLQRYCKADEEWLPFDAEFWYTRRDGKVQCRGCLKRATRRWRLAHVEQARRSEASQKRRQRAARAGVTPRRKDVARPSSSQDATYANSAVAA